MNFFSKSEWMAPAALTAWLFMGIGPGAAFVFTGGEEAHQAEQRIGGGNQPLQAGFLEAVAGQVIGLLGGRQFGELGLDLAADRGHGGIWRVGQRALAKFALTLGHPGRVAFARFQRHIEHRLAREELKAADAFLIVGVDRELA